MALPAVLSPNRAAFPHDPDANQNGIYASFQWKHTALSDSNSFSTLTSSTDDISQILQRLSAFGIQTQTSIDGSPPWNSTDQVVQQVDNARLTIFEHPQTSHLQSSITPILPALTVTPLSTQFNAVPLNVQYGFAIQLRYFHDFVQRVLGYHPYAFRLASDEEIAEEISCWRPDQSDHFASQIQRWMDIELDSPQARVKRENRNLKRQLARERAEAVFIERESQMGQVQGQVEQDQDLDWVEGEGGKEREVVGKEKERSATRLGKRSTGENEEGAFKRERLDH